MEKTLILEPTAEEAKVIETEMDNVFSKIECIDERIKKDQEEIDRLTVKTRAMLDQLKAR